MGFIWIKGLGCRVQILSITNIFVTIFTDVMNYQHTASATCLRHALVLPVRMRQFEVWGLVFCRRDD